MKSFDVQPALESFPDLAVGFLVTPASPYAVDEAAGTSARVMDRLVSEHQTADRIRENPMWDGYRNFYSAMNVRASSVSTPLKQAARFLKLGAYRPIHPVVDVCMEIEYAMLCSFQVYDYARVGSSIAYSPSPGDELLNDAPEGGVTRPGELVLRDELGLINSPTLGNDHSRLVGDESHRALVRILKIPSLDRQVFERALDEAAKRLGADDVLVLDRDRPDTDAAAPA